MEFHNMSLLSVKPLFRRLIEAVGYEIRRCDLPHTNVWGDVARLSAEIVNPVVVDVGANVGTSCLQIVKRIPFAIVHCVEPDPVTFAKLEKNVSSLPGVTNWQLAMGNSEGVARLYQNVSADTNSFLKTAGEIQQENWRRLMQTVSETEVPVTTLASWCEQNQIEKIHLLKTDCQGYDLAVLEGAESLLRSGKVDLLLCEVLMTPLYEQQSWLPDIVSYVGRFGFHLHGFYEINYDARGDMAWADALFVRRIKEVKP